MKKNVLLRIGKIYIFFHNMSSDLLNKHFAFIRLIWKNTYPELIKGVRGSGRSMEFSDTEICKSVLPRIREQGADFLPLLGPHGHSNNGQLSPPLFVKATCIVNFICFSIKTSLFPCISTSSNFDYFDLSRSLFLWAPVYYTMTWYI